MTQQQLLQLFLPILILLPVLYFRMRRMSRARPLKLERMWIGPAIFLAITALVLIAPGPHGEQHQLDHAGLDLAGRWPAVAGAAAGWYWGRTMAIEVHPEDGTLMVKGGQAAILVLLMLILFRTGLRTGLEVEGRAWHLDMLLISDASIVFTALLFTVRSVEMYIRARRVMAGRPNVSFRHPIRCRRGASPCYAPAMSRTPASEAARRRTFAIISHPDAGKTTLTEHLLLLGGAIHAAGRVKARGEARRAKSDWMKIEQERGISVTSAVMTFEYKDAVFNLLDTPGHEDFSEDTYRTLTAADSAVMVIDAAKGIEAQTRKLFEVCRLRDIPIMTFVNKMDREARDPFELLGRDFRPAPDRDRAHDVAGRHGAELQGRP